jgi:hypothetical protein
VRRRHILGFEAEGRRLPVYARTSRGNLHAAEIYFCMRLASGCLRPAGDGAKMSATGSILRRRHRLGGEVKQALLLACILFNFGFTDKTQTKATFSSYHGGKRYDFEVTAEQLTNCPAWVEGQDNPPLPARRAIEIATNYLPKLFPDAEKWEMSGFSVIPVGEKWVYLVQFIEPAPENVSEHLTTEFKIVVLMNGSVGRLKVSPWKLS